MKAEIILEWMIKNKWSANTIYRLYYHCSSRNKNSQNWMAAHPAFKNHKKQKTALRFCHEQILVYSQNEKKK